METKQDSYTYLELEDRDGKPITLISTQLKTPTEFVSALNQYDKDKSLPKGFTAFPGGMSNIRAGFEQYIHEPTAKYIPQVTAQAAGNLARAGATVTGVSPTLKLAEMLGIVQPGTYESAISKASDVGRLGGQVLAEEFSTPGRATATVASTAAAPFMAGTMGAKGGLQVLNLLRNIGLGGLVGSAGYTTGSMLGGEDFDPASTVGQFILHAGSSGLQGVTSYFLTKYIHPNLQEEVANKIVRTIKNKPIEMTGSKELSEMTQEMAAGLRISSDMAVTDLTNYVKNILPTGLNRSQNARLREAAKRLIPAQNNVIDSFYKSPDELNKAKDVLNKVGEGFVETAMSFFKNVQGKDRMQSNIQSAIKANTEQFSEAARVLHYLRESGQGEKVDLMRFAQMIRGVYQDQPGSKLEQVGNILGGGRPLTELPLPRDPSQPTLTSMAYDFIKNLSPHIVAQSLPASSAIRGSSVRGVPWQAPADPLSRFFSTPRAAVQTGLRPLVETGINQAFGESGEQNYIDRKRNR